MKIIVSHMIRGDKVRNKDTILVQVQMGVSCSNMSFCLSSLNLYTKDYLHGEE